MLEVMIETWSSPQSGVTYRWSAWADGKRVAMGGPHAAPADCEDEAQAVCEERFGRPADRVTRL